MYYIFKFPTTESTRIFSQKMINRERENYFPYTSQIGTHFTNRCIYIL